MIINYYYIYKNVKILPKQPNQMSDNKNPIIFLAQPVFFIQQLPVIYNFVNTHTISNDTDVTSTIQRNLLNLNFEETNLVKENNENEIAQLHPSFNNQLTIITPKGGIFSVFNILKKRTEIYLINWKFRYC